MIQGYARARGYKKPSQWNAENVISHNYCKKKKKMARESFTPLKFEVRIIAYAKTAHVFQSKSSGKTVGVAVFVQHFYVLNVCLKVHMQHKRNQADLAAT